MRRNMLTSQEMMSSLLLLKFNNETLHTTVVFLIVVWLNADLQDQGMHLHTIFCCYHTCTCKVQYCVTFSAERISMVKIAHVHYRYTHN